MTSLSPFDPNDYRKRVLAVVERRGGPEASDPFELYDLPLDGVEDLPDAVVAIRVADVWGFWQRQRDHPKYRALVALLVEQHAARSAELLDGGRRRAAAARVRALRQQRDEERHALLDAAISRLVQRHGAVPTDKVAGLVEVGALAGLTADEVAARLRRHRTAPPKPAGISAGRRRQLRTLLDEFGRLTDAEPPATLLALLGLGPAATSQQITVGAGAWRSRARELPPGRLRAVVDELMVHVAEVLEAGRAAVAGYLDAVAADVTELLRPQLRAAVLVEDRLVAEDHAHLMDVARGRGLDERRAAAVLAALAAEVGVDAGPSAEPAPRAADPLKEVRAALRAGRPRAARRLLDAGGIGAGGIDAAGIDTPAGRALAAEIDDVLAAAGRRHEAAVAAARERRFVEALSHLDHLERVAADVADDLVERQDAARAVLARADAGVAAACSGPQAQRAAALAAVLDACRDHAGARAALDALPLPAPAWVSAARDGRGDVVVLWNPSTTAGVTYRVRRERPDGTWQVVGRVGQSSIEDGGAPPGVEAPVYAVAVLQAGRTSAETRSDASPPPRAPFRRSGPAAPGRVAAVRAVDGTVEIRWDAVAGNQVEYRVRCEQGGRWRVVGRTRATRMEDGGAPDGVVGVYAVSAATGGERSPETRTDG